jgi:ribosome-associated toxin RatA of RatAB toxin-antitoxin module
MQSSISIDVHAPPRLVFDLARDIERWPDLLPHYREVRVLERHDDGSITARMLATRMVVRRLGYGIPVAWRARAGSDPAGLELWFRHLGGATSGMAVTWHLEPAVDGCRVTIEHIFEPRVPGWARLLDALFVRPIAGRTLATFKAIAEAAHAAEASPALSAGSRRRASAKESA